MKLFLTIFCNDILSKRAVRYTFQRNVLPSFSGPKWSAWKCIQNACVHDHVNYIGNKKNRFICTVSWMFYNLRLFVALTLKYLYSFTENLRYFLWNCWRVSGNRALCVTVWGIRTERCVSQMIEVTSDFSEICIQNIWSTS
jgi:hypothetical protein